MNKSFRMGMLVFAMSASGTPRNTQAEEFCKEGDTDNCLPIENSDSPKTEVSSTIQVDVESLHARIVALESHTEERELAELMADAETAITTEAESEDRELTSKEFRGGERSLQALNPEISVVGDFFGRFLSQDGEIYTSRSRSGIFPRVLGFHFQSNLDPFSFAKMVIGVTPSGVLFGEGYITWNSVTPWLSLTFGKFHQQFGVVNRWHAPGLDQFEYPLVLQEHFGGALNQAGIAAVILMPPLWADVLELELQITNGQNEKLFSGDFFSIPSGLVHLRNYWDINRNTYMELGFSGTIGVNNPWGKPSEGSPIPVQLYDENGNEVTFYDVQGNPVNTTTNPGVISIDRDSDWRLTVVGGADLTINWEPVKRAKYKGFTWRTEFLYAYKEIEDEAGFDDAITSWGAYSYVQYKPIRNWIFGVRGDLTQPFILENDRKYIWAVVPYITWWQSPWVRLRIEYDQIRRFNETPEHRTMFQVTFSVGPHKHERY